MTLVSLIDRRREENAARPPRKSITSTFVTGQASPEIRVSVATRGADPNPPKQPQKPRNKVEIRLIPVSHRKQTMSALQNAGKNTEVECVTNRACLALKTRDLPSLPSPFSAMWLIDSIGLKRRFPISQPTCVSRLVCGSWLRKCGENRCATVVIALVVSRLALAWVKPWVAIGCSSLPQRVLATPARNVG